MSFFLSFFAARFKSLRTLLRVALLVSRSVVANPCFLAMARISLASNSQPESSPDQPLYCLGSTAFKPMCRDIPDGMGFSFLGLETPHSECNGPPPTSLILQRRPWLSLLAPSNSTARIQEALTQTFLGDDRVPDPVVDARSRLNFQCRISRFYRESDRLRHKHHLDPRHVASAFSAQRGI